MNEEAAAGKNDPPPQGEQEGAWKPNPEFLQSLMAMGIQKAAAETALQLTGNQSAELAASFLFDNEEDWGAQVDELSRNPGDINALEEWSAPAVEVAMAQGEGGSHKMVFVVNMELHMGIGKIAAQVAHAALGVHKKLQYLSSSFKDALTHWEETGEKTVVVRCSNGGELKQLHEKADSMQIPACIVHDAGRTQVAPNSATVLGIFGTEKDVDEVTGKLPLL